MLRVNSFFLTGIFNSSLTERLALRAGGLTAFLIAVILLLSACKFAFLEFTAKESVRSSGYNTFKIFHSLLGWSIVILAGFHSLYYLYYYYNARVMDLPMMLSGLGALAGVMIVMLTGRYLATKKHMFKSTYKIHNLVLIVTIILLLWHLNVR